MNVGKFEKCPVCKDYGWFGGDRGNHVCLPEWECRLEQHDDNWWNNIHASDAEGAAKKYAEHYDCEGGEYAIVSGRFRGNCIVLVRAIGSDTVERWAIEAETVPKYYAARVEEEPALTQDE